MGVLRYLNMPKAGIRTADGSIAKNVGMRSDDAVMSALADIGVFQQALESFGVADWCEFDTGVVRGLAYYTGIVYEVYDAAQSLRAVAGGGRYDNLLEVLGGPKLAGTGFGMGDVVLGILLEEKGKLPSDDKLPGRGLDFFVVDADGSSPEQVLAVVAALRRGGASADFSYKRQPLGKQLKEANRRGAARAAICRGATVTVKNLASGEQIDRPVQDFLARPLG
jgi:histidyl-tRNA synthetase